MSKAKKPNKIQAPHAHAKMVRIAPRKMKLVIDLIRGMSIEEAKYTLKASDRIASSEVIYKLINSAQANAVENHGMSEDNLYVKAIYANEGPTLKRIRPRAQGRASAINKRTSHITVIVDEMK